MRVPPQVAASQKINYGGMENTILRDILQPAVPGLQIAGWQSGKSEANFQNLVLNLQICVEIYTHPRISQSDFPVMHFVALQHKSTKMINNIFVDTIGI